MKRHHLVIFIVVEIFCLLYPGSHYIRAYADRPIDPIAKVPSRHLIPSVNHRTASPVVSAEGLFVVDIGSWTPVLIRNEQASLFPASTTKMITALTSRRLYPQHMIVDVKVATTEGQLMDLHDGERITVENLLYGSLVHSANDAAYALAWAGGDPTAFVAEMNQTAYAVGMRASRFTNPAGFDEPDMYSTPRDLAFAARAILADPYLRAMVSTKSITVLDEDFRYAHQLTNVNQLLGVVPGLGGVKTGLTEGAGQNLVSYYKQPDTSHEYLIVVMKSEDRFKDTEAIIKWLQTDVSYVSTEE
ncbi:MAG: hypothetical protein WCJ70_03660 [bacterium]